MINLKLYVDVDFAKLVDVKGELIFGMPPTGLGKLLVWDLEPEANLGHRHIYVAVSNNPAHKGYAHALWDWPPKLEVDVSSVTPDEPIECPHCGSSLIYCSDPDGSDEWGCHDCKKSFKYAGPPCNHDPDTHTVRPADGAEGVCDVLCKKCGCSGSFRFEAHTAEIMWEEG